MRQISVSLLVGFLISYIPEGIIIEFSRKLLYRLFYIRYFIAKLYEFL